LPARRGDVVVFEPANTEKKEEKAKSAMREREGKKLKGRETNCLMTAMDRSLRRSMSG